MPSAEYSLTSQDGMFMPGHVSIDVDNDAHGIQRARHEVEHFLRSADEGVRSSAVLLISELVTNALMYGDPPVIAAVDQCGTEVRISVSDTGHDSPFVRPSPDETGGFGLRIVDALCGRWGCDFSRAGKTVWCELAAPSVAA